MTDTGMSGMKMEGTKTIGANMAGMNSGRVDATEYSPQLHPVLHIKRAYVQAEQSDGYRILVDRLWPRGLSKERASLDDWMKAIAPTPELRTWWNHDPQRLDEFAHRYRAELDGNHAVEELADIIARHPTVTLIYAAKDPQVNHAVVLRDYMNERMAQ
jgi:uncharacterized protein YeaO (DUF488 family)